MDGPGRSRPMGGTLHAHGTHGFRRHRRGVASIVGALLVLVIALVAFTLIFTQAVPVWMAQNESVLSEQVQASFAQLQATVDLQAALGSPHVGLTSVGLTSASVPVLAAPTQGSLLFEPNAGIAFANLSVSPGAGGTNAYDTNVTLGEISVVLPNRYIPSATISFESGAVFVAGGASAARMLFGPLFSVDHSGANTTVVWTVVSMTGPPQGVSAPGTQQISDTLGSVTVATSHGPVLPDGGYGAIGLTLRIGSPNACAWAGYFAGALASAGVPISTYSVVGPPSCPGGPASFGVTTVTMSSVTSAAVTWIDLAVSLDGAGA